MSDDAAAAPDLDPIATVDDWRARGAAQAEPVRFGVIEALARRAAAQQGQARRLLARRVEQLLAEHAAAPAAAARSDEPAAGLTALAGLSELVDRLGRAPASRPAASLRSGTASRTEPPRPLKAVTAFQETWSRLRAEQRLRQALAQVPAQAGPLNSSHVVHRALQTMRALSPAYLDAFMSHVDTLLALEQAGGAGDLAPRSAAVRTDSGRRPVVRAPRKA